MLKYRNILVGILIYLLITSLFSLGSLLYCDLFIMKAELNLSPFLMYLGNTFVAILCFLVGWFLLKKEYTANKSLIFLLIAVVLMFGLNVAEGYYTTTQIKHVSDLTKFMTQRIDFMASYGIMSGVLKVSFIAYLCIAALLKKDVSDSQ